MSLDKFWRYLPFIIAIASLLYYLTYFNYGLTMNDEGLLIDNVTRVLEGQLPLRDFYSYAPARYYYLAGWFRLFGANLLTERFAFMVVRILTPAFLFVIARRFLPSSVAIIPTLMIALVAGPWEKTVDTFIPIFNLWWILESLYKPQPHRLVLAGIVAGLSLMWKQDAGSLTILAGSICVIVLNNVGFAKLSERSVWKEKLSRWLTYLAGISLGILPFAFYYALHNAVAELFLGQYTAVRVYQTIGVSFPSPVLLLDLAHPGKVLEVSLIYAYLLILISFPFILFLKFRNRESVSTSLIALWVFGCAASPNIFVYPAFSRLTQTGPLAYILGTIEIVWVFQALRARWNLAPNLARSFAAICLLIPLAFFIFGLADNNMYVGSIGIRIGRNTLLGLDHAPVYESSVLVQDIQEAVRWIKQKSAPGSSIFASSDYFLYFLADRQNPTGVYFFPNLLNQDSGLQTRLLADLEKSKPAILSRRNYELTRVTPSSQWWENYIQQNYTLVSQNSTNLIYLRKFGQ